MAREKWPFCWDSELRAGFDYKQTENFLRHLRELVPSMTDEEEAAVYRYMWNGNINPLAIDAMVAGKRLGDDAERFADNPALAARAIRKAYAKHAYQSVEKVNAERFARIIGGTF